MVKGIGVDIIEIARIRRTIEDLGPAFLGKVFTDGEIAYCSGKQNQYQHYAARFAAKEAMSKALSTGWAGEFRWKDVEVTNDPSGQPRITLHHRLQELCARAMVLLTISHSDTHVVAMVLLQEEP
jgi:holo-[acyl-carrier protein] synthase